MISKINEMTIEEFNQLIDALLDKKIGPLQEQIEHLTNKLEELEFIFVQEEEINDNEMRELDIISKEIKEKGIPWKKLRAELEL
jgi:uncharacterized coiled-coil protein SlyX